MRRGGIKVEIPFGHRSRDGEQYDENDEGIRKALCPKTTITQEATKTTATNSFFFPFFSLFLFLIVRARRKPVSPFLPWPFPSLPSLGLTTTGDGVGRARRRRRAVIVPTVRRPASVLAAARPARLSSTGGGFCPAPAKHPNCPSRARKMGQLKPPKCRSKVYRGVLSCFRSGRQAAGPNVRPGRGVFAASLSG